MEHNLMSTLSIKELSHPSGEVIKIAAGKTLDLKSQGTTTLPTGSVLQVKNVVLRTLVSTSSSIPFDNTIPQITEGAEAFTLAITPSNASSKLKISAYGMGASATNNRQLIFALFKDTTADALAVSIGGFQAAGTAEMGINLEHFMTAGTTNAITFRLRFASNNGTGYLNGSGSEQRFGGSAATGMTIMEIQG